MGSSGRLLTTTDILDDTIQSADIAPNAVTQSAVALGVTATPSTSSGSPVVLTDMSVTLTTTGGPVLLWFSAMVYANAVINVQFTLRVNGVDQGIVRGVSPGGGAYGMPSLQHWLALAAGTYTFAIYWHVSAGSGTASGEDVHRSLMVAELKR